MPEEDNRVEVIKPTYVLRIRKRDGREIVITPAGTSEAVTEKGRKGEEEGAPVSISDVSEGEEELSDAGMSEPLEGSAGELVVRSMTVDGQIIPNAPFVVIGEDGKEYPGSTDESGEYIFTDLPPGKYTVRFLGPNELKGQDSDDKGAAGGPELKGKVGGGTEW